MCHAAETVSVSDVAKKLKLDKSAASRRIRIALDRGFLRNAETVKGRPWQLSLGEPLSDDIDVLPHPDRLRDCCAVATVLQEIVEDNSSERRPPVVQPTQRERWQIDLGAQAATFVPKLSKDCMVVRLCPVQGQRCRSLTSTVNVAGTHRSHTTFELSAVRLRYRYFEFKTNYACVPA